MAHIPRLYVDASLSAENPVALEDAQGKYLTRVMRMVDGDTVRAFNGRDGEWRTSLSVQGKRAALLPLEQTRPQVSVPDLTLLFAPLKKARTDFVIEKATELGVRHIQPVTTEYTQTNRVRTERMRTLAIEAAEQTERLDIPAFSADVPLKGLLSTWDASLPIIYCDEGADGSSPMANVLPSMASKAAAILIGPEGGFSPNEQQSLRARDFVIPVTLGPRILRAETAVVSALTLWQSLVGDWQQPPYVAPT